MTSPGSGFLPVFSALPVPNVMQMQKGNDARSRESEDRRTRRLENEKGERKRLKEVCITEALTRL